MNKRTLFSFVLAVAFTASMAGQAAASASFDITPYGYIKADMAWDSQTTTNGNYALYVEPVVNGEKKSQFNMTAKETRLGLKVLNNDLKDVTVKGVVEIDFYGSTGAENKGNIQMRHAFIEAACPHGKLVAGQTWDVISPNVMTTLNYSVGWAIGNIGYRRPQLRVATKVADKKIAIDLAAVRPIGNDLDVAAVGDADGIDDGEGSGGPHWQGRVGLDLPNIILGISGHYGRLKAVNDVNTATSRYETKSINGDIKIPYKKLLVKGEIFAGENLRTYLGSILNNDTVSGVRSSGGWLDAAYNFTQAMKAVVGFGKERVNDQDIALNARETNQVLFGNFQYTAKHGVMYGVELSGFKTGYKGASDAKSTRLQFSSKYAF